VLFNAILVLLVIGIVAVYDASYVQIARKSGDGLYYLKKQLVYAGLGLGALIFAHRFRYWRLKRLAVPLLFISFCCLVAVWIPGIGITLNGARRWIGVGPLQFQPSELAKLSLIIYLAALLAKNLEGRGYNIRSFSDGLLAPLVVVGAFVLLVEREPDLGTAFVMGLSAISLFFIAGAQKKHLAVILAAGAGFVLLVTMLHGFRGGRLTGFLNPHAHADTLNYQPLHSFRAVGSGGITGLGIGAGREKFYLPEANTDYIFATVAEETGLLGSVVVVGLLMVVSLRAREIARITRDPFGSLLAAGIGAMVSIQALVNIAVVTGSMPSTGVPLPFISYGGTSLIFTLAGIGVLLNISQYPDGMRIERAVVKKRSDSVPAADDEVTKRVAGGRGRR
jgi:cell division protein FtsW